ncbi:MAG: D-tyrosyl-tRNA(Tyr) deacylase [Candidatus Omnitrophica bacterium]|nr:D-tyrosyl-tRNA(Tyr) deacylase [Candidatus Omnitrophota bacterium]
MKVFVARVTEGKIVVADEPIGSILKGISVFVGFENGDTEENLSAMAEKVVNLRIFEDNQGKLAYSAKDKGYAILAIPNFTLCASADKGRRPSFDNSMPYQLAEKFFDDFVLVLKTYGLEVEEGVFGAHMNINLGLDGPVNIVLDSKK